MVYLIFICTIKNETRRSEKSWILLHLCIFIHLTPSLILPLSKGGMSYRPESLVGEGRIGEGLEEVEGKRKKKKRRKGSRYTYTTQELHGLLTYMALGEQPQGSHLRRLDCGLWAIF